MNMHTEVLPEPLPTEPLVLASHWLTAAWQRLDQPNPNAMVLATVGTDGQPSARVVLCKEIVAQPGYVVFYTNYHSRKGRQIEQNPRAAVVMHWDHLRRQVRLEGPVVKAPEADSEAYFASRPWQRRVGAWASSQSEPIGSRDEMLAALEHACRRFGAPLPGHEGAGSDLDVLVPRPPHWGGYHLWAESVELWVEGESRIHDRARWSRSLTALEDGMFAATPWSATRLQP